MPLLAVPSQGPLSGSAAFALVLGGIPLGVLSVRVMVRLRRADHRVGRWRMRPPAVLECAAVSIVVWSIFDVLLPDVTAAEGLPPLGPPTSIVAAVLLALGVIVVYPLSEELYFRGLLFGWLRSHMRPMLAQGVTAVAFAASHGYVPIDMASLVSTINVLAHGLVYGWLVARHATVLAGVLAHGLSNGLSLGALFLGI